MISRMLHLVIPRSVPHKPYRQRAWYVVHGIRYDNNTSKSSMACIITMEHGEPILSTVIFNQTRLKCFNRTLILNF